MPKEIQQMFLSHGITSKREMKVTQAH